jgi:hypothetical protein
MVTEIFFAIITGIIPIGIFAIRYKKISFLGLVLLLFLLLSVIVDSFNLFFYVNNLNNLFLINIYDYFAIFLELLFLIIASKPNGRVLFIGASIIIIYWCWHFIFNIDNGLYNLSTELSFVLSCLVLVFCFYCTIRILTGTSSFFNESKYRLIAIIGLFVFESACLIPVCTSNLNLEPEERKYLSDLYNHVIVVGSIVRNVLFSLYFILDNRIHKKERVSNSLVI